MKIEKGVPMPPAGRGRKYKYDWHLMEVGDSSEFEIAPGERTADHKAYQSARYFGKKSGREFAGRKIGSTLRIWRTK